MKSLNAFKVIADLHQEMGAPGLVYCIEKLGDNYDKLEPYEQRAYDEFYDELEEFCRLQNG